MVRVDDFLIGQPFRIFQQELQWHQRFGQRGQGHQIADIFRIARDLSGIRRPGFARRRGGTDGDGSPDELALRRLAPNVVDLDQRFGTAFGAHFTGMNHAADRLNFEDALGVEREFRGRAVQVRLVQHFVGTVAKAADHVDARVRVTGAGDVGGTQNHRSARRVVSILGRENRAAGIAHFFRYLRIRPAIAGLLVGVVIRVRHDRFHVREVAPPTVDPLNVRIEFQNVRVRIEMGHDQPPDGRLVAPGRRFLRAACIRNGLLAVNEITRPDVVPRFYDAEIKVVPTLERPAFEAFVTSIIRSGAVAGVGGGGIGIARADRLGARARHDDAVGQFLGFVQVARFARLEARRQAAEIVKIAEAVFVRSGPRLGPVEDQFPRRCRDAFDAARLQHVRQLVVRIVGNTVGVRVFPIDLRLL